ncbi:C40 family peptidase [Xylanibacillus composti]|uniref:NlpC/P60 domain-containing protein n=1 Tax=Xylanibacillus composti TaxID=1572762 RepID=A0A8J4H2Q0_9BACL|nr:C40 family peptidase [Xylanibacillus composti]GIQ69887.1 hypothetical protein XYCOK13_27110 [Xylanibacillus composti]
MKRLLRAMGISLVALSIGVVSACANTNQDQARQQSVEDKNQKQKNKNGKSKQAQEKGNRSNQATSKNKKSQANNKGNKKRRILENDGLSNQRQFNLMQTPQQAIPIRDQQNEVRDDQVSVVEMNGEVYAPLLPLMRKAGFRFVQQDAETGAFQIGDHDIVYVLRSNSNQAMKEEATVQLPDAVREINGQPYVSIESLQQLFGNEITAEWDGSDRIQLQPAPDLMPNDTAQDLDFAEDPTGEDTEVWQSLDSEIWEAEAEPVLKNINIDSMINEARKYLGVKYKFGAKPYSSSNKRFDCSSYTRFIFDKYGVDLPRTARAQARKGTTVSRKSLKKGDLLYFYVPGRFKKEKTIGHVGIYMGNQRMIHSSPEPKDGVQITDINKSYWKETFVTAKRIVK